MGRRSEFSWRVVASLSLILAVLFALPLTSFGQAKQTPGVDKDNPFDRLQSQQRQNGTVTPAYRNKILQEAQKHNQRMGRNSSGVEVGTPGQGTTGPNWINIGPFGQQFAQNGGFTGEIVDSGRLRTILPHPTDPNIVYILSSAGGLWKTTNFEAAIPNWTPLTDYLPTTAGGAAAFGRTPNVIYLGLGDPYDQVTVGGSIVKSTDGGATWSPMINLGNTISVRDVKVDTSASADIVLVATDGGLWRSVDAGATYNQVVGTAGVQFQNQYIWSLTRSSAGWVMATQETLAQTNGNCIPATRWCSGYGHIYLSTDKGATWTEQFSGLTSTLSRMTLASIDGGSVVYALAASPNGTSAAVNQRDVYRSADGGKTWVALGVNSTKAPIVKYPYQQNMNILTGQAWYNQAIGVDPNDSTGNTVYIGGTYSSAKSTDGGATWSVLSQWLYDYTPGFPYMHADMHAIAFKTAGTKMVLYGTDGGIFASSDNGTTWDSAKNNNLATHMFYTITGNQFFPNFAMGGLQDNGTRVRVGNTGIFNQSLGGDGFGVAMSQANTETSFQSVYYNKIERWRTGVPPANYTQSELSLPGQNQATSPFNTPVIAPGPAADPSGLVFFSQGLTSLWKTIDGGMNWVNFSAIGTTPGLDASGFRDSEFGFAVSPTNINHIAVGTNGGRVYVSLDGGANWAYTLKSDTPVGWPGFISSVTWGDDNTIWATSTAQSEGLYTGVATVRVVKSTDQGATWTAAGAGLPDVPVTKVQIDPRDANTVYAATHVGIYRTTDGGTTWTPFGSGLPNVRVNDIYMPPDGGYLRIATYGRGIWQLANVDYVGAALVNDGAACDHTGNVGNNETGHLVLTFQNARTTAVAGGTVTVASDNPHLTFTAGHDAPLGTVAANSTATASLGVKVVGAVGIEVANLTITYGDSAPVTIKRPITLNYDDKANASGTAANWESQYSGWTVTSATSPKLGDITTWERLEISPVLHHMAVTDANGVQDTSLVSPVLHVGAANFSFSFNHRFAFENTWDGGILEISTDNGTTWTQITTGFTAGGYNATLLPAPTSDNPIAGSAAWSNLSTNWPLYSNVAVDLGTAYANKDIRIRLRATADGGSGRQGWEIADMSFVGLTNTPFGSVAAHNEACTSTATVSSNPNPSMYPDEVTFTAVVLGGVTPVTGIVNLKEGSNTIGSAAAVNGTAIIKLSTLPPGTHNVVASFAGDAGHAAVNSPVYKHTVLAVPRATLTPNTLDFGDVHNGITSPVMTSVLKNIGTAPLQVSGIVASGNFSQTNNCSTFLAAGASCTISVTFKPVGVPGARTGTVTLTSDKVSGDASIALTGKAVSSAVSLSRTSVPFANTLVGFSPAVQTVTVTNNGNLPLTIASIAATGDYTQTNDCPATPIAVAGTCTVSVTFKPTAASSRAGTLTITDDAFDATQTVSLSGKGEHLQISGTTSQAVAKEAKATYPLTLKSSTGFAGVVSLACSGAPALTTCAFDTASPTMVASGTTAVSVTITPAPSTTTASAAQTGEIFFAAFGLLGLLLLPLARKASGLKVMSVILLALVITISVGGMVACGGSSTPAPTTHTVTTFATPGTYPITITAKDAAGNTLQTQALTLTLQ